MVDVKEIKEEIKKLPVPETWDELAEWRESVDEVMKKYGWEYVDGWDDEGAYAVYQKGKEKISIALERGKVSFYSGDVREVEIWEEI